MRAFIALLTILAMTLAVQAQGRHGKRHSSDQTSSKPRGDDKAYKKALSSCRTRNTTLGAGCAEPTSSGLAFVAQYVFDVLQVTLPIFGSLFQVWPSGEY